MKKISVVLYVKTDHYTVYATVYEQLIFADKTGRLWDNKPYPNADYAKEIEAELNIKSSFDDIDYPEILTIADRDIGAFNIRCNNVIKFMTPTTPSPVITLLNSEGSILFTWTFRR